MALLGVNIDHVATVRQARRTDEPDPVWAAVEAELGGAEGITFHLREDRRHIIDRDARLLKETVGVKLNMEMAVAEDVVRIAEQLRPDQCTLVPERREELTTEGGLDVIRHSDRIGHVVRRLRDAGIIVSAFIEPIGEQISACAELGFHAIELWTGRFAHASPTATVTQSVPPLTRSPHRDAVNLKQERALGNPSEPQASACATNQPPASTAPGPTARPHVPAVGAQLRTERAAALEELRRAIDTGYDAGLEVHGGHGLTYRNIGPIAAMPGFIELNIGHSIIARSVFVGLRRAVREMKDLIARGTPPA